jgi:hypothetical protein
MAGQPLKVLSPKNQKPVVDHGQWWEIPGYEGAYFNKEIAKRKMKLEEFIQALQGKGEILEKFKNKDDKEFKAKLVYNPEKRKMDFEFAPRAAAKTLDVKCPKSGQPVVEMEKFYKFPGYDGVAFWKNMFGKDFSAEETANILENGSESNPIETTGLISQKTGKPYTAGLYFNLAENKIKLVFANNPDRAPAKSPKAKAPTKRAKPEAVEENEDPSDFSGAMEDDPDNS